MIKKFIIEKYGSYVANHLINDRNEIIKDNINTDGKQEQLEVVTFLKSLQNEDGTNLVPDNFWKNESVKWGVDVSSWIGDCNNKDFFFIGAEPHLFHNFQLVYDFGTYNNCSLEETAMRHYGREDDIWFYLAKTFVDDLTPENITKFLNKCHITDLCHIAPKFCGQVSEITNKLSIKPKEWKSFRSNVAKKFLLNEIKAVDPKYIILHGNPSREFFQKEFGVDYTDTFEIENSKYSIKTAMLKNYKIISIPHLKGDVRNKLWKCKTYPERPLSAKKIIKELTKP